MSPSRGQLLRGNSASRYDLPLSAVRRELAMPVLPGMKAGGYYDQHSSYQRVTVESLFPWIDQAVAGMALPDEGRPFTVADYGCSEGSNSILAVGQVISAFRHRRPAQS